MPKVVAGEWGEDGAEETGEGEWGEDGAEETGAGEWREDGAEETGLEREVVVEVTGLLLLVYLAGE